MDVIFKCQTVIVIGGTNCSNAMVISAQSYWVFVLSS